MQNIFLRYKSILIIDLALFILCFAGVYQIWHKAALPFDLHRGQYLRISRTNGSDTDVMINDRLASIDGITFHSREEIELYIDGKFIGDRVNIEIIRGSEKHLARVSLTQCYTPFYMVTAFLTGMIFFAIAVFVLINASEKTAALLSIMWLLLQLL